MWRLLTRPTGAIPPPPRPEHPGTSARTFPGPRRASGDDVLGGASTRFAGTRQPPQLPDPTTRKQRLVQRPRRARRHRTLAGTCTDGVRLAFMSKPIDPNGGSNYRYYMKPVELKVTRIGNSRGVCLPAPTLERYRIGATVVMEERSDGILLRPPGSAGPKLSWEETAREMAAEAKTVKRCESRVAAVADPSD